MHIYILYICLMYVCIYILVYVCVYRIMVSILFNIIMANGQPFILVRSKLMTKDAVRPVL